MAVSTAATDRNGGPTWTTTRGWASSRWAAAIRAPAWSRRAEPRPARANHASRRWDCADGAYAAAHRSRRAADEPATYAAARSAAAELCGAPRQQRDMNWLTTNSPRPATKAAASIRTTRYRRHSDSIDRHLAPLVYR